MSSDITVIVTPPAAIAVLPALTVPAVNAGGDLTGTYPNPTVLARLRVVDPIDPAYGALGDGTTDDGPAILAATSAAGVGGTLFFRAGKTYRTTRSFAPLAGQTWWGYGAAVKRCDEIKSTTATVITAGQTATVTVASAVGFVVGQEVTVFNGATYESVKHPINAINGNILTLGGLFVTNFPSGGTVLVVVSGIYMSADAPGVSILGLEFSGNRANNTAFPHWELHAEIRLASTRGVVRDCYVHDAVSEGIYVGGTGVTVEHNFVLNCGGNGIHLSAVTGTTVTRNWVQNVNLFGAPTGHADGCIIASNAVYDTIISGNYCQNGYSGIGSWDQADNIDLTVTGNTIRDMVNTAMDFVCPQVSTGKFVITANRIYNSGLLDINNAGTPPTAGVGPFRIIFADNYLETSRLEVKAAYNVLVRGNVFVSPADVTNIGIRIVDSQQIAVHDNLVEGFQYGIYITCTAVARTQNVAVRGNIMRNQNTMAIAHDSTVAGAISQIVQGNTIATEAGIASASFIGIRPANNCHVLSNILDLQSGQYGIQCPNGGASANGAVVNGNIIRSTGLTGSIQAGGGSVNNWITGNYTQQAIVNSAAGGVNTVAGNYTIF